MTLSPRVLDFLASPRFATLATINPDGSPHQTVIWYLLRGDQLVINSLVGRRWPSNLRRDPRMSISVEKGLDYVAIRGIASEIGDAQSAQADIAEMARRYETPEEAARLIEVRFGPQQRLSFSIEPTHINEHWEG